jgi:uncharacterized membrane protein YwaF
MLITIDFQNFTLTHVEFEFISIFPIMQCKYQYTDSEIQYNVQMTIMSPVLTIFIWDSPNFSNFRFL